MKNILILCTGNSCRSIIAEALINAKIDGVQAYSSGVNPSGRVNPNAKKVLQENGIWRDEYHSKTLDTLKDVDFDLVVTVCDHANETCPTFPSKVPVIHIGFEDPDGKEYSEFVKCYKQIEDRLILEIKKYYYVLTPLTLDELKNFFDETALSVISYFLKKSIISQPEKLETQIEDLPIHIPKEHIEQWIVQALGAKPLGAGSYPIDIITDNWGADIKMLSCKVDKDNNLTNADSGETSLAQKFGDNNFGENITLDTLFSRKKRHIIWCQWKKILISKYKKVEQEHDITDIYYFIVLRAGSKFHLCGLKVNLSNLKNTKINNQRSTNDSIWITNFIEDTYGHIKIYKAKKRLELRLKPKKWVDNNMVISFDTNFEQISTDIRGKIINNELDDYIDDILIPIIKQ